MIQIKDPEYYQKLCARYERELEQQVGRRVWLDSSFYIGFKHWVKKNYNIDNDGTSMLTFENDHDYTLFMLKWNSHVRME